MSRGTILCTFSPSPPQRSLMCRQKVAEVAKDEPLFKRSQQTLGSQKSGRFGAAALNLMPSGMEVSDALTAAAAEEPDPTIRARLRGALAADANGVQSIQVWDPVGLPDVQRCCCRYGDTGNPLQQQPPQLTLGISLRGGGGAVDAGPRGTLYSSSLPMLTLGISVYHCVSVCTTMHRPPFKF